MSAAAGAAIEGFINAASAAGSSWANIAALALSGGGGSIDSWAQRAIAASSSPIVMSAPSGPAISSATNRPTVRPDDPPDDLPDEVAEREGVVAGRRARLPPRLRRGEDAGHLVPVRQVVDA